MIKTLFSQQWYKVVDLKPKLKRHCEIIRHVYRDQIWYVLKDTLTGQHHRFSPAAYQLISHMDGEKNMQSIWEKSVAALGAEAPTQDEAVQLLGQLHAVDVLVSDVSPDVQELFLRHKKHKSQKLKQRLLSPMAIKIPLIDPDVKLSGMVVLFRNLFSLPGLVCWLLIVAWALLTAGIHWAELTENISDTVMSPSNIVVMALLFPLIKAAHELGHAMAVKVWGGEVHEMGVMLLVFMPIPYVDASAASALRESHRRFIVGAAGMMVELAIAALALWVWLDADAGLLKSIAYNVILITGISTLFFNANPLLRFDGYYMLSDLLQMPNLYGRANKYFFYLIQRYLFAVRQAESSVLVPSEKKWLVAYSILSFFYRAFIAIIISIFIASEFFVVGVLLAGWSLLSMFVIPLFKGVWFLIQDPKLGVQRRRAIALVATSLCLAVAILGGYPLSSWTNAEGVVLLPDRSLVRAKVDCTVSAYLTSPGQQVESGQSLILCEDPLLEMEMKVAEARLQEAEVNYLAALSEDPSSAELVLKEIKTIQSEIDYQANKIESFTIKSGGVGRFVVPVEQDLLDRYLKQGEVIGYVIPDETMIVRSVVNQQDVGSVRSDTKSIELRRVSDINTVYRGIVSSEVPGGNDRLPSPVLGTSGGGEIAVVPGQQEGLMTFQKVFQFDVRVKSEFKPKVFEERVLVRFHHTDEPLAQQWYDRIRHLVRDKFDV